MCWPDNDKLPLDQLVQSQVLKVTQITAMQTENAKSLSTEECAWKFSKKGT
jgi:hypothetical protein